MMQFADLHTHTKLCNHAGGESAEYLKRAMDAGLRWFGISDHFPAPSGYDSEFRMLPLEYSRYREIVRRSQEEAEGSGMEVLYATEFDYVPGRMREVYDLLDREDFDYTIGSVHYVDGFAFDDPAKIPEWQKRGVDAVWTRYTELLCEFVTGFHFEIMAHADLPKKFGFFPTDTASFLMRMRSVFEIAARKDVCLELNTAGLRKPVHEIYPSLELLKLAKDAGMRITFGSDAHAPIEVAAGLKEAVELAVAAGFRSHVIFRRRKAFEIGF